GCNEPFFFFQAEDGIRDRNVTGVQTCALPISCRDGAVQISVGNEKMWQRFCEAFDLDAADPRFATNGERFANRDELISQIEERRSEERRVGKEWSSRWWPWHVDTDGTKCAIAA